MGINVAIVAVKDVIAHQVIINLQKPNVLVSNCVPSHDGYVESLTPIWWYKDIGLLGYNYEIRSLMSWIGALRRDMREIITVVSIGYK